MSDKILFPWKDNDWSRLKQLVKNIVDELNSLLSGRPTINFRGSTLTNVQAEINHVFMLKDGTYLYTFNGQIGKIESEAVWQIKRTGADGTVTYPSGDKRFRFVAANYASYSYR